MGEPLHNNCNSAMHVRRLMNFLLETHVLSVSTSSRRPRRRKHVPGTGVEPARPKAQPSEDCASTNFATRVGAKCPERDSNPHALTDTWPSTMPVYQFQHLGSALKRVPLTPSFFVTPLGLEPRTLSLKVRCSNQLS